LQSGREQRTSDRIQDKKRKEKTVKFAFSHKIRQREDQGDGRSLGGKIVENQCHSVKKKEQQENMKEGVSPIAAQQQKPARPIASFPDDVLSNDIISSVAS
jgi:hypothetical protein